MYIHAHVLQISYVDCQYIDWQKHQHEDATQVPAMFVQDVCKLKTVGCLSAGKEDILRYTHPGTTTTNSYK